VRFGRNDWRDLRVNVVLIFMWTNRASVRNQREKRLHAGQKEAKCSKRAFLFNLFLMLIAALKNFYFAANTGVPRAFCSAKK
jgi:hypothetical protein